MKPILSPEARPVLDDVARNRALLVFDFDGTLAPIVADRREAEMRPETRPLLCAVAMLYPTAIVSGRARDDVASRVRGIPLLAVVGNHGAEAGQGPLDRSRRSLVVAWRKSLTEALRSEVGVEVEDKHFSLAVHYRAAPCKSAARRALSKATAHLDGARVFGGRAVVNVVPKDAPDKATAVAELRDRAGARHVVYVGDDRTDEDVFRAGNVDVTIRVGRTGHSSAEYYVPRQTEIDEFLRALLVARTRADGRGERWEGLVRAVDPGHKCPHRMTIDG